MIVRSLMMKDRYVWTFLDSFRPIAVVMIKLFEPTLENLNLVEYNKISNLLDALLLATLSLSFGEFFWHIYAHTK